MLGPAVAPAIVEALRPAAPSASLGELLTAAAAGRYAELLREVPIASDERAVAAAVRGLAQYALGDSPTAAAVPLQQALQMGGVAAGPVQALLGACRAAAGSDRDAVAAWQAALDAGLPASVLAVAMGEAWLRLRDPARAAAALRMSGATRDDDALAYASIATALAAADTAAALTLADAHLQDHDDAAVASCGCVGCTTTWPAARAGRRQRPGPASPRWPGRTSAPADRYAALVEEWTAVLPAP